MQLTRSDGGTLYLVSDDVQKLEFKVLRNHSLGIDLGGIHSPIDWPALPIYHEDGTPNLGNVSTFCLNKRELINIDDVYATERFNFEKMKAYDEKSGYHSQSMLVVPLSDHEAEVIGVLQLINKKDPLGDTAIYDERDVKIARSLSSLAAVSINNQRLISDLQILLERFLDTVNLALDEKSPYTAGHIGRVVELSMMMAEALSKDQHLFAHKHYDYHQLKEIQIAAMMHDIGKIVTPEHIMDKRTKLETIFDRITLVRTKAEILKRDLKIAMLEALLQGGDASALQSGYQEQIAWIESDVEFLTQANQGAEFFTKEAIARVEAIAQRSLVIGGVEVKLLNEDEVENLCVQKGTLTESQRHEINNHAFVSYKMLKGLPFPKKALRSNEDFVVHGQR